MADQLSLSIWLERPFQTSRLPQFEKLLRLFPFSQREQPESLISIQAVAATEPPLLERPINGPPDIDDVVATLRDYQGEDVAYHLESWWDLWHFETDWELRPTRVLLSCFAPEFDNGTERSSAEQEDLRIEFGLDSHFLPRNDAPGSTKMIESNIRSLLRLVHELDLTLAVAKRKLETESGENFADRLQEVLTSGTRIQ